MENHPSLTRRPRVIIAAFYQCERRISKRRGRPTFFLGSCHSHSAYIHHSTLTNSSKSSRGRLTRVEIWRIGCCQGRLARVKIFINRGQLWRIKCCQAAEFGAFVRAKARSTCHAKDAAFLPKRSEPRPGVGFWSPRVCRITRVYMRVCGIFSRGQFGAGSTLLARACRSFAASETL